MTVSKSVGMALEVAYYTVFPMHEELQRLLLLLLLLLLLYSVSQKTDRYD